MPSTFTLIDFDGIELEFPGRGVIFGSTYWDGTTALALTHLAETEGVITLTPNVATQSVTMPEQRGDAPLRSWEAGRAPTLEIPAFLQDPDARAFFSARSSASAGNKRWRPVLYKTLLIAPEDLMWDENTGTYRTLSHTGGVWTVGGEAPTARQALMIKQMVFIWRVFFEDAPVARGVANDGRDLHTVTGRVAPDTSKPDGHELYTFGSDLAASGIDLDAEGS